MRNSTLFPMIFILLSGLMAAGCGKGPAQEASAVPGAGAGMLAPEGEKIPLPDGGWFTWRFAEKPKLGTVVVKIQAYDAAGKRTKKYGVAGEYGMPSMRYHDSGPVRFQLNKKDDYLLPVNLVMQGEWEIKIRLRLEGKDVYEGKALFAL